MTAREVLDAIEQRAAAATPGPEALAKDVQETITEVLGANG